jgi:amino-acid N-acetyltransferase
LRAHPSVTRATLREGWGTTAGYPRGTPVDRADSVGRVPAVVRRARTPDVPAIKSIVDVYAGSGRKLLAKELVTLYEDVQDFLVAEVAGEVVGCGALHVLWADLGEVRTLAVRPDCANQRIGQQVLDALITTGRELGLSRLFALTFHTGFFGRAGFAPIEGAPVEPDTYDALRRSYDPGVAEFLNLEYVKPNTLGNTRMLLDLS